jgi:hypothetical protein
MMEGSVSGSVPMTNGSGSGEAQKLTDPDLDLEHWFKEDLKTNEIVKLAWDTLFNKYYSEALSTY